MAREQKKSPNHPEQGHHWIIGDLHGCFDTFQALLEEISFDPCRDRLWLVGDLVNRGPKSLDILRWARKADRELEGRFAAVLGNHDLYLLRRHHGLVAPRSKDTFAELLQAPDVGKLLSWLRSLPLLVRHGKITMVHAGLAPKWTVDKAEKKARKIETRLRASGGVTALLGEAGGEDKSLRKMRRDLDIFTRIRTCTDEGELCDFSGPPEDAPTACIPWFRVQGRRHQGSAIYFGHWAALGLHQEGSVTCLDSGCAWGGRLTALRVADGKIVQKPVRDQL